MTTIQKRIAKIEDDLMKLDKQGLTIQRDFVKRMETLDSRVVASLETITVRVNQIEETLVKHKEERLAAQHDFDKIKLDMNNNSSASATTLGNSLASRIDQIELGIGNQQQRTDANTTGVLTCIARVKYELGNLEREKAGNKRVSDDALKRIDEMAEEKRFTNSVLNDLLARVKALEDMDDGVMVEHC